MAHTFSCKKWIITPALAALLFSSIQSNALSQSCTMSQIDVHGDAQTRIYSAEQGVPSLYYSANMDVNTDGAPRSYHPDDPRANSLALNNMGNAITRIFDARGNDITCSPRQGACYTSFIETFEAARDAQYAPTGVPRIETRWIIPWQRDVALGWDVPCTIQNGPDEGFFVSQTSVLVDSTLGICEQRRYLDSTSINANVLPRGINWRSQGTITDRTDLIVARDSRTGRIAFGINGDRGPARKIGEGSIAFVTSLSGVQLNGDETYQEIRALARPEVQYLIFPTHDIRRLAGNGFTQTDIDSFGQEVFEAWGGEERLLSCGQLN